MIINILCSFRDLRSLCITSKPYYLLAQRQNLFTKKTIEELKSRNVNILPRDVIVPKSCTHLDITARIIGSATTFCSENQLAAALKAFYIESWKVMPQLRVWQCYTLLELIDVVQWDLYLDVPPEKLAIEVDDPMEIITDERDTHVGRVLDSSDPWDAHELSKGDSERWLVRICKNEDWEIQGHISHLHSFEKIDTSAVSPLHNGCAQLNNLYQAHERGYFSR